MATARAPRRHRQLGTWCLLALLIGVLTAAGPAAATAPADDLLTRLGDARQLAESAVADPSPERMAEVRDRAGPATDVEIAGVIVEVAPRAVLAELEGDRAEDFETAAVVLDQLEAELGAATQVAPPDRDALADALETAYAGIRSDLNALEQLNRLIGDLFLRLLFATAEVEGLLRLALIVALAALTVGLAIWIVRRVGLVRERRTGAPDTRDDDQPDWRSLSDEALARGDLEAALRASYRALLVTLDARGLLRDQPSLTAAKARRRLAANGDLRPKVEAATVTFERVAYAGERASRDSVETIRDATRAASRR